MRNTTTRRNRKPRRAAHVPAYRARLARLASKVDRDRAEAARFRTVRDADLTGPEREEITTALREYLTNRFSGEVGYDSDIEVAYHAEFPLASAWLLFSATEAPEVGEVFDRLGLAIDPHHWDDGWGEYHDKWAVRCPSCNGVAYGVPGGDIEQSVTRGTWPDKCECGAEIPKPHHPEIIGGGTAWFADCTCGWNKDADAPTYKSRASARGQVTRHLKSEGATQAA